ncbi:hypothetical protein PCANC_19966, partial [Puccinia coronata f. sp. avenae]
MDFPQGSYRKDLGYVFGNNYQYRHAVPGMTCPPSRSEAARRSAHDLLNEQAMAWLGAQDMACSVSKSWAARRTASDLLGGQVMPCSPSRPRPARRAGHDLLTEQVCGLQLLGGQAMTSSPHPAHRAGYELRRLL